MDRQSDFVADRQQVVQCLQFIVMGQMLKESHEYLAKCQRVSGYVETLFNIVEQLPVSPLKQASFLYLVNYVKRNTHSNRRSNAIVNLDSKKPLIKERILTYCRTRPQGIKWKHIKQFLRHLSAMEYPHNWPELQQHMLLILQSLTNGALDNRKIEDVDLIKTVMKTEAKKSSFMKKSNAFNEVISKIAEPIEQMSILLDQELKSTTGMPNQLQLVCSSYFDRTILSCLHTITTECITSRPQLAQILRRLMAKIELYVGMLQRWPSEFLIKAIKRVVFGMGTLQSSFPLLYAPFLTEYLRLLVNLMKLSENLSKLDSHQLISKSSTWGLIRVVRTYYYYISEEEFRSSIMGRNISQQLGRLRLVCYQQYYDFFTPAVVQQLFNSTILHQLSHHSEEMEEQLEEEEVSNMQEMESSLYNIGVTFLNYLMERFKNTSAAIVGSILNTIILSNFNLNISIQINTYYMLLILPKVYSQEELPRDSILTIMEYQFSNRQCHRIYPLMLSKYYDLLDKQRLQVEFNRMVQLTKTSNDIITIFQSSKTISTMISNRMNDLDISGLKDTLSILINMFTRFKSPTAVMHLMKLTQTILDNLELDSQIVSECLQLQALKDIMQNPDEAFIYMLCDFLQGMLSKSNRTDVIVLALSFLHRNMQKSLDNPQVLYKLWAFCISRYELDNSMNQQVLKLLEVHGQHVAEDHPKEYLQLLQEYLLVGLLKMTTEQICQVIMKYDGGEQYLNASINIYFIGLLLQPDCPISQQIIQTIFNSLQEYEKKTSSPKKLEVRSSMVNTINFFICRSASEFNNFMTMMGVSTVDWTKLWLTSSRFMYSYETQKLNAMAHLLMLEYLTAEQVTTDFELLIRLSMSHLEPNDELLLSMTQKNKLSRRKELMKKSMPIVKLDLRPLFKDKIGQLVRRIGLTEQYIREQIKSPELVDRFMHFAA